MHRLDDETLITPLLLRRFSDEAAHEGGDPDRYHAFLQKADRSFVEHRLALPCDPMQRVFALDLLRILNQELHHDGAWVILFTNPKPALPFAGSTEHERFCLIWLDKDGDPAFTLDWLEGESEELDFDDVILSGKESWVDRAEAAWQNWHFLMRQVLEPKPEQLIKKARGQVSAAQN